MILELSVENIAVIEHTCLELGPGFTVLTGETGAGKSLLVDAIGLALGDRADADLVRSGARRGVVSLVADLRGVASAQALAEEAGAELEDGTLFVQREVWAEGRSTTRIGGRQAPVGVLKRLGETLVDLHGQHDHQALLDPERHLDYLDLWIGWPARDLLDKVRQAHADWEQARSNLNALKRGIRDREQRLDMLRFQIQEIETVEPVAGEIAELEGRLSRLQHAEKLASVSFSAIESLRDQEGAALEALGAAVANLEQVCSLDPSLESVIEPLKSSLYALDEGTRELSSYADSIESDPALLEEVAARLDAVKRLVQKYGDSEAAVLEYLRGLQAELLVLEDADLSEQALKDRLDAAAASLHSLCAELSALRSERSKDFAAEVQQELRELAMDKALFEVSLSPREPDPRGADSLVFLFTANVGETPKPLNKIASGGEMSRVMLALKVVLAGKAGVPTLIFDEIDSGLSGRAAAVVARKLKQISEFYQVLAISHLPQLAGSADRHYRIEKLEEGGRTHTHVRLLEGEERVREVARMLAGEEIGASALANARELIGVESYAVE